MGTTTELRRELKKRFLPYVQRSGFVLDERDAPTIWRFRRNAGTEVHIFEVQWEKYGTPRFVINFGRCPIEGPTINGRHYTAEAVSVGWLEVTGRLQPVRGASARHWFRQDKRFLTKLWSSEKLVPAEEVVSQLLQLFQEVEAYWDSGVLGPHVRIFERGG